MVRKPSLLVLSIVAALTLAGCTSERSHPDILYISGRSFTPSPVVNLTAEDLPQYPPLKELLEKWEASGGKIVGFETPYPYEQGLELVKSLQARVPDAKWSATNYVPIKYKGQVFDVIASKVHTDG